ncbi:MAG: nucleotide exchange factor GrpE [Betaproteobacteria bacterium]|nr:nucleotide exchange factor GrpE [Betaproteobacteria bacterium]MBU6513398.1 nucleotide exchange factor GrpE [Betaproteobacteria bacterium]MDE1956462.1 nucleotide exchange factor GrpE [Betaproteobacteria bacterium]MDE2153733.1 nucleotide exchange factor GrpE [Betaproteobacteria bacterium]
MTQTPPNESPAAQAADPTPAADEQARAQAAGGDALEQALKAAQDELEALKDQFLRAKAEAENVRRRGEEESARARKFAVESMAQELLPVKDSLEAALADASGSIEALKKGVELTLSQLRGAFERSRIQEVEPAAGERFDPARHQAIASIPSEQAPNTVVAVLQKGYVLAERTLRPAMVTVAAAPAQPGAAGA